MKAITGFVTYARCSIYFISYGKVEEEEKEEEDDDDDDDYNDDDGTLRLLTEALFYLSSVADR